MTTPTKEERVFKAFVDYRSAIGKSEPRKTTAAIGKIQKALSNASVKDLLILFEFLAANDHEYAQFLNGDNDNKRFYGTLDNLFRASKLQEKINRAHNWKKKADQKKADQPKDLFVPFQIVEKKEVQDD